MNNYILSLIIFFFLINSSGTELENDYIKNSNKFISQLLSEKTFDNTLLVKPEKSYNLVDIYETEMPQINIRKILIKNLKLNNTIELDELINKSNSFDFTDSFSDYNTNLISKSEFDSIQKEEILRIKKDNNFVSKQIYFISKPMFDKEYKTVIIDINQANTCIITKPLIYKKIKGKWKLSKLLF